jgi:hypothetical protein
MSYNFNIPAEEIFPITSSSDYVKKNDTFNTWRKKTNWLIQDSGRDIVLGTDTSGNFISAITGTANRVIVTGSGSENALVTLSLPQDIATSSSVTFGSVTTSGSVTAGTSLSSSSVSTGSLTVSGSATIGTNLTVSGSSATTNKGTFGSIETPNLRVTSVANLTGSNLTASGITGSTITSTGSLNGDSIAGRIITSSSSIEGNAIIGNVISGTTINGSTITSLGLLTGSDLRATTATLGTTTFTNNTTANGSLLVKGTTELQENLSVTNNKKIIVPSGLLNLRGIDYTFPTGALSNGYLKYGNNGQLSWATIDVQSSAIVFEDVLPVGVIVRWDDTELPNTKWSLCNNSLISSLDISASDKTKLYNIYTSRIPNANGYIIKIASDNIVNFQVNLSDGITGTKNGGTVTQFDGTSDGTVSTSLVTLKANYDNTTIGLVGNQLAVKSGVFLSLASGGIVNGKTTIAGGSDITSGNNTSGRVLVGDITGTHLAVDGNSLQSRTGSSGTAAALELNPFGGAVTVNFTPSASNDVVNKSYADGKLSLTGGSVSGKVKSPLSVAIEDDSQLVTKVYTDTTFLKKSGGTLTGALTLPSGDPSDNLHATKKAYVDSKVSLEATARSNADTTLQTNIDGKLSLTGGTLTAGDLTLFRAPTSDLHATTKSYVDGNFLSSQKDSVTKGNITLARDPVIPLETATKQYVDRVLGYNLRFSINIPEVVLATADRKFANWSRTLITGSDSNQYYEYTISYNTANQEYGSIEPGHWIIWGIKSYLWGGYYEVSYNENGTLKFISQHTGFSTGSGFSSPNVNVATVSGQNVPAFAAVNDFENKTVTILNPNRLTAANTDAIINLKNGYELPPLNDDVESPSYSDYSVNTSANIRGLYLQTSAYVGDKPLSSTILTRNRSYDFLGLKDKKGYLNPRWNNTVAEGTSDAFFSFSRRSIPVELWPTSYYNIVDISYKPTTESSVNVPDYDYVSFISVGYNYSNNPASPKGTVQSGDLFDDSATIVLGGVVYNTKWNDSINVSWNINDGKYYYQYGNSTANKRNEFRYASPKNQVIYFGYGNEGGGPYGIWKDGNTSGAKYMVSIKNVTTGKTTTYILTYRDGYSKGGTASGVTFKDGNWYRDRLLNTKIVNGSSYNNFTATIQTVTTT